MGVSGAAGRGIRWRAGSRRATKSHPPLLIIFFQIHDFSCFATGGAIRSKCRTTCISRGIERERKHRLCTGRQAIQNSKFLICSITFLTHLPCLDYIHTYIDSCLYQPTSAQSPLIIQSTLPQRILFPPSSQRSIYQS